MEPAQRSTRERQAPASAVETVGARPKVAEFVDLHPEAADRRALAATMREGPAAVAQRQEVRSLFGTAARLGAGSDDQASLTNRAAGVAPPTRRPSVVQRTIQVDSMNEGNVFQDSGNNVVPARYGFSPAAKTLFLVWVRDNVPHHMATQPEMIAKVTEAAEGEHTLARHGPTISNPALEKRLFTGIAPDNVLSPAPGSSSRFLSYESVLETRQAAATAMRNAIVAAQADVLAWSANVLQSGGLAAAVATKTGERDAARNQVPLLLQDFTNFGPANQMVAKKQRIERLEGENRQRGERLGEVEGELRGGVDMWGNVTDPAQGAEKLALDQEKDALTLDIQNADAQLLVLRPQYDLLQVGLNSRRDAHRQAADVGAPQAEAALATAVDEQANPGKNLTKYLRARNSLQLAVADTTGAATLGADVKLLEQYTLVVDHQKPIGTGVESPDGVSLTDVVAQVAIDPAQADPQPKPRIDILAALQVLGLVNEQAALADFLSDAANLKRAKVKGGKGGKVFKTAQAAGNLNKTFTNFGVGGKVLFDGAGRTVAPTPAVWKAIQHFPAKNDAPVGIEEVG